MAIIGYGSQGHAHALNLRDSGVAVRVGLPAAQPVAREGRGRGAARDHVAEAAAWADVVMLLTPDTTQPAIYRDVDRAATSRPGKMLMFAHGFNIRFGMHRAAARRRCRRWSRRSRRAIACVRCSSRAAARRRCSPSIRTPPAAPATLALSYAAAHRHAPAPACIETTFAEETETDLFGEQTVLCGGVSALVKAGFETLVEAGYQPEIAYFECLHELKLIVDLMYRGGLNYMRYSVSDTAEHGDYTGGPRIITDETRQAMRQILSEIQDGTYAKAWIAENAPRTARRSTRHASVSSTSRSKRSGARLREMMPFLKPVRIAEPVGR